MSSTKYIRGPSLAVFFLKLQQAGRSVSEMKAFLDQRIRHGVITVKPSLPASWRLRPMGFDGFMIETADGYLNAGEFHCYYWGRVPDWLKLPLPVQAAPTEAQHPRPRRLKAPAAEREAKRQNSKLKQPDGWQESRTWRAMKRDDYKAECMTKFPGLTERALGPDPACRAQESRPAGARKARSKEANEKIIIAPILRTCSLPASLVR